MLIIYPVCKAQRLDIKPYFLYHQTVSKQNEPVFYDDYTDIPYNYYPFLGYLPSFVNSDFTLASGLEYGFAIDYTFRNNLGFELGLGYFNSLVDKKETRLTPPMPMPVDGVTTNFCTTDWNYHSIAMRPLFSYTVLIGKSAVIGKTGPTIHYVSATRNIFYMDEKILTCTFANRLNWGYSTILEYDYQLSEQFSLAIELGFEQYKYTPNKATVEYGERFVHGGEKDEILYVNKISYDLDRSNYSQLPKERLKESILFNNIYFGIGIKYNLWKK